MLIVKSRDANRKATQGLGPDYTGSYVIVEVKGVNARLNQRSNGPVNANLISWPSKAHYLKNIL